MEETKTISRSKIDLFFWSLIVVMIASGVFANYYFRELAWTIRFASWIVLIIATIGLAYVTTQGRKLWEFIKSAKMELYKVVWPTRDEAVKTTIIVATLVFATSIILWAIDSFLLWLVAWFTS